MKWPNVATGDNVWLWKHEWDKHGTCSEHVAFGTQKEYFSFGIRAYSSFNLESILAINQITPNGVYTKKDVQRAIKGKTGLQPAVRCNTNTWTKESQLHEISICYDKFAQSLVDCPSNANKCGDDFVWYAWNTAKVVSEE